jgi:hypothetical protein
MRRILCSVIVIGLCISLSSVAEARTSKEMTYRYNQIWNTAIRFLRVDNGYPIDEKDKKAGYVLFQYKDSGKMRNGYLELVEVVVSKREYVRVTIRIDDKPGYVVNMVLDKLTRKLRDEYGDAPLARLVEPLSSENSSSKGKKNKNAASKEPPDDEDDLQVDKQELEDAQEE